MRPETRQYLSDSRSAATEILSLATGDWQQDRTVSLAIERLLMILGEALVRVRDSEITTLEEVTDARKIIGMRNVLVHAYDSLDSSRIADAIQVNLPAFVEEIDQLLS